jgi:transcriptional regulator with XRE-family HTH domain
MGVSPSAFRKWLKGEAEPSRERLIALAHAAGVGVAWLAEGEGPIPAFEPVSGARSRPNGRDAPVAMDWSKYVLLPRQAEAAAAGPVTPPDPAGTEWMALRHDWIRSVCRV